MYLKFNIASVDTEQGNYRKSLTSVLLSSYDIKYEFYDGEVTKDRFDGLYLTAKQIMTDHIDDEFVIFAEDDLVLTSEFAIEKFASFIKTGQEMELDCLITGSSHGGGYSGTTVSNLVKVLAFRGTQLIIVYKKAYDRLLKAPVYNHFENTISYTEPSLNLAITVPYLSKQRKDIESMIVAGNRNHMFDTEEEKIMLLKKNNFKEQF